ncbi:MAG: glycosyltransferase family 4 protein [Wenzhouxiangella sp.]
MDPIIYILHSGNLYGTERMALATLAGLAESRRLLLAPPGPVHAEAEALGIDSRRFSGMAELARHLAGPLLNHQRVNLIATGVSHSLIAQTLAGLSGCRLNHLHIVHGGTDERLSYGRKSWLGAMPIRLIAVSDFVRQRLLAHGCRAERIQVVENFLPRPVKQRRSSDFSAGIRSVAVVSRVDPIKRVHLLLEAIERRPELADIQFHVYGQGSDFEAIQARAERTACVHLHGFVPDAADRLAEHDLLLHTCAEEPFGLAILEAMASGLPVLVPNAGGAGSLVNDPVSGFHFPANCSGGLANRLCQLLALPPRHLNAVVDQADRALGHRFSPARGLADYRALLTGVAA